MVKKKRGRYLSITKSTIDNPGILPESVANLDEEEVYIYTKGMEVLGVNVGEQQYLVVEPKEFVQFQDGLSFEIGDTVIGLFQIGNQIEVRRLK